MAANGFRCRFVASAIVSAYDRPGGCFVGRGLFLADRPRERKAKARKLARKSRFFELAHLTPRREFAPFLKAEAIEHLGANAKALGKKFDPQVRALAEKGLSIRAIARVLNVSHTTVLKRGKRRHKR